MTAVNVIWRHDVIVYGVIVTWRKQETNRFLKTLLMFVCVDDSKSVYQTAAKRMRRQLDNNAYKVSSVQVTR